MEKTTDLWEMYKRGIDYQNSTKLRQQIPRYIDFYEGKQWSSTIPKGTESMPRCQINIIKQTCRNKKANILSVPYRLTYSSLTDKEKSVIFTRFAEYQQKAMGMKELDSEAMDSGIKTGTYIYHFYWDKDAYNRIEGKRGGAVACELLDPLNVFFANPNEPEEQRQKWILIKSRVDADSLKEIADKDVELSLIEHDEEDENVYETEEQKGSNLVTLLTRYFRKDGEVYCERATKTTIVNKPFSITPDFETTSEKVSEEEDAPDTTLMENSKKRRVKASLYPIVVGQYEERKNCIYGLSEVEGIIPNQQAINQIISMQAYNVTMNSWSKWKVSPAALNGQKITNDPGQVLIDYDPTGNGISKIRDEGFSSAPTTIAESIISLTRNACGSNEVTNGEVLGANMSGSAIAQLQAQASKPTEELRERFWRVKVKCGKVLAQFFLLFYDEEKFTYVDADDVKQIEQVGVFNVKDYEGLTAESFDIQIEATGGTRATTASDIQFLETMFNKGAISALTFAKLYPDDAIANKSEVLRAIEMEQNNQLAALQQQLMQAQQQLQQSAELIQKQSKIVDNVTAVIKENNTLKAQLIGLYNEANEKIQVANAAISQYGETKQDAEDFANYIVKHQANNSQGIA